MSENIVIFWNKKAKQHDGMPYEQHAHYAPPTAKQFIERINCHRFIKHSDNILIELPPLHSNEDEIILYYLNEGLQIRRDFNSQDAAWHITIADIEEVHPNIFCVHDLIATITTHDNYSYQLLHMDAFHYAFTHAFLPDNLYDKAMTSLASLLNKLNQGTFSYDELDRLADTYRSETEQVTPR